MIRRVVECETCKEQVDIPPELDFSRPSAWVIPESWFTLVEGNPQTNVPWHFCSLSHLCQWSSNRLNSKSKEDEI